MMPGIAMDKTQAGSTKGTALDFVRRGLPLTVCAEKHPLGFNWSIDLPGTDWGNKTWTAPEIERAFRIRGELNVGIMLGPTAGIIDIEADSEEEERHFADLFDGCEIPRTPEFKSKRGRHRLFAWHPDLAQAGKGVVKFRKLGCRIGADGKAIHSCIPPSATGGTAREWICSLSDCAPAQLPPAVVARILQAAKEKKNGAAVANYSPSLSSHDVMRRARKYLANVPPAISGQNGHDETYKTACKVVLGFNLDRSGALTVLGEWNQTCQPPWSDHELEHKVDDALNAEGERGYLLEAPRVNGVHRLQLSESDSSHNGQSVIDADGLVPLGQQDPSSGRFVFSAQRTLPTALTYIAKHHKHEDGPTLRYYAGGIYEWDGSRYVPLEDDAVKSRLHRWLHDGLQYKPGKEGELKLVPFGANPTSVKAALDTIKAQTHLSAAVPLPSWIDGSDGPPAEEILICKSGLWHLPTDKRLSASPLLFATNALDYDPDPNAPEPEAWFHFLIQLFENDDESIQLLQEWAGYILTASTRLQKMLLMVGPRRSGKGTIARIFARLIGAGNVCGPTTESLARQFGLAPLVNKTLAIVSDARFHGESIPTVVERLLCITGEDPITVDRKFLPSITLKLATRFMILTNETPRLHDSSGALAGRFVILRLEKSFYGNEDHGLTDRLLSELPGILNWAIEGWHRLHARGRFVMPQSVQEAVSDLEDLGSPVGAFVREACIVAPGRRVSLPELYEAWRKWCAKDGRTTFSTAQTFGKDLAAAVPGVKRRRGTGDVPFYEGIGLREVF
ncbi:MAG: DUF5906 domain-containing protein [Planctomycetia bacterium]|nr:DUF5906 domain-containing protein [Planctomycetia bacterium]